MRFLPVWIPHRVEFVCAVVDAADLPRLKGRWSVDPGGYAFRTRYLRYDRARHDDVNVVEKMHRVVLRLGPGNPFEGDHRNGNRLDNRKSNLRRVTPLEQSQNRAKHTYTPCDIKPWMPVCIRGDVTDEQFLNSLDMAGFNVVDIDTYGDPWKSFRNIFERVARRTVIFLTHGLVAGEGGGSAVSVFCS